MTIQAIRKELQEAPEYMIPGLIQKYEQDERSGVQKLVEASRKRLIQIEQERQRIEGMKEFERAHPECNYICGIDEVGRGPLAGPVVAGAVIFPKDVDILYINDSKQLSEAKREKLCAEIYEKALAVGIGMATPEVIDEINILQANYRAMKTAIANLSVTPELLLNDAVTIPGVSIPQVAIIKGDTKSISIAAASIVAKVFRDHLMVEYDKLYPQYGFAKNKGYGSQEHIAAIREYGPCEIHRKTFIRKFTAE